MDGTQRDCDWSTSYRAGCLHACPLRQRRCGFQMAENVRCVDECIRVSRFPRNNIVVEHASPRIPPSVPYGPHRCHTLDVARRYVTAFIPPILRPYQARNGARDDEDSLPSLRLRCSRNRSLCIFRTLRFLSCSSVASSVVIGLQSTVVRISRCRGQTSGKV